MNPAIAYRAIIRLVAGDFAGYETLVSEPSHLVNVKYFYNKNKCVKAKLDTSTGDLYIGNLVKKWGRC